MSENFNLIQKIRYIQLFRIFSDWMMVLKCQEELLSIANVLINELISDDVVDKIINKYEKYPCSF